MFIQLIDLYLRVFSWGWGVHGQLGHSSVEDQLQPRHVTALDPVRVTQMSGGYCHSLVVSADGQVYIFGAGTFGQLGLGKQVMKRNIPTLLDGFDGKRVTLVACGLFHNVSIDLFQLFLGSNDLFVLIEMLLVFSKKCCPKGFSKPGWFIQIFLDLCRVTLDTDLCQLIYFLIYSF